MRLSRWLIASLFFCLFWAGCAHTKAAPDVAWIERCAVTDGWRFCFQVPQSGNKRVSQGFKDADMYDGRHAIYSPWQSWNGVDWDGVVADLSASQLSLSADDKDGELIAWANLWDKAARERDIAAGKNGDSIPNAFDVSLYVDGQGRRWVRGTRKSRWLRWPHVRIEQKFVTPIDGGRMKFELSFECSHPHPHCSHPERMVSAANWKKDAGG